MSSSAPRMATTSAAFGRDTTAIKAGKRKTFGLLTPRPLLFKDNRKFRHRAFNKGRCKLRRKFKDSISLIRQTHNISSQRLMATLEAAFPCREVRLR